MSLKALVNFTVGTKGSVELKCPAMPKKKQKKDFAPHLPADDAPPCHVTGCGGAGLYKAPKSREELSEYKFLCLEHIREHNAQWDFFSGMKSDEIEAFISDSVTGHRPTWSREERVRFSTTTLHDKLYEFMNGKPAPKPTNPHLPAKERRALALLELEYPYSEKQLKTCYRALVKKHHPDIHKGDKQQEEKFKQISMAYRLLLDALVK